MNKSLSTFLKVLVSALLIYILFRRIDFAEVISSWKNIMPMTIAAVIALYFFAILVNCFKWKLFLPEQGFGRLFQFTFIDIFYGMALPGQISGEVAKAFRLGKRTGNMKKVAVSIWMDKITGLIGLVFVALIGISFSERLFPPSLYIIITLLLALGIASIYIFDFPAVSGFLNRRMTWVPLKSILSSLEEFKKSHTVVFLNILLGALYQLFSVLITMTLARTFGIHISIVDWFWIFGFVSVLQFLPISIAGLGVREVSFVGILALFSVSSAVALSLSLSIFAVQLLFAFIGFLVESHYNLSHN